jgi:hypothetical protein
VLAVTMLFAATCLGAETPLSVEEYRGELARLESALRNEDVDAAREQTKVLLASTVSWRGETLAPDASVLRPISSLSQKSEALPHAERVAALGRALDSSSNVLAADRPADHQRLDRLRRAQAPPTLEKGGSVGNPNLRPVSLPERIQEALAAFWDWIVETARKVWHWLKELWPRRRARGEPSSFGLNLGVLSMVAVITALLALMAVRALRRSTAGGEELSQLEARSARDEDPLSREANEWEAYALELAARGRRREAIRAWYHAVLVTLFRTGTLHYHKGRTNWEYVSRIAPEAAWRPTFAEMTRVFDREWYGRDSSSSESLHDCMQGARRILGVLRRAEAPA